MKFLSNKTEPQSAENIAFAQRLSAIADRGRGIVKPESIADLQPSIPATGEQSWKSSDFPDFGEQSAAA